MQHLAPRTTPHRITSPLAVESPREPSAPELAHHLVALGEW
jgi:hypothetical protein